MSNRKIALILAAGYIAVFAAVGLTLSAVGPVVLAMTAGV